MPRPYNLKGRSKRLQAALRKFGGDAHLGKMLTPPATRQAVNQWKDIPPGRVKQIERLMAR